MTVANHLFINCARPPIDGRVVEDAIEVLQ